MSLNKVMLIGYLGNNPDIRSNKNGEEVVSFSMATSETWKDKSTGEKKTKTEWHKIVVFSQGLIAIIKTYVKKGSRVYVEGQLQTNKWTDKEGQDKYSTEVILKGYNASMRLLDSSNIEKEKDDELAF